MIIGLSGLAGSGKDFVSDILVERYNFVKIAFADPLKRICKEIFDFSDDQLWGPSEKRNESDKRYFTGRVKSANSAAEEVMFQEDARILLTLENTVNGGDFLSAREQPEPSQEEIDQYLREYLKIYLTPRFALQSLGTEWGRNCYPLIWSHYTFRLIDKLLAGGYRYDNKKGLYEDISSLPPRGIVITDARFRNEMDLIKGRGGKVVRLVGIRGTSLMGRAAQHASETEQRSIPDSYFDYICHNDVDIGKLIFNLDEMLETLSK